MITNPIITPFDSLLNTLVDLSVIRHELVVVIPDKKKRPKGLSFYGYGVPKGIRTPVTAVKGRCPRPTRRWGHCGTTSK